MVENTTKHCGMGIKNGLGHEQVKYTGCKITPTFSVLCIGDIFSACYVTGLCEKCELIDYTE